MDAALAQVTSPYEAGSTHTTHREMTRLGTGNGGDRWQATQMVFAIFIAVALIGVVASWGATTNADAADVIASRPSLRHVA